MVRAPCCSTVHSYECCPCITICTERAVGAGAFVACGFAHLEVLEQLAAGASASQRLARVLDLETVDAWLRSAARRLAHPVVVGSRAGLPLRLI